MRDLPGGTVTFLFTDIEGSTRLLRELGADRYAEALTEHRRVLRGAFERHGGVEVDTQGDAFFVAFPTAPGALEAAREAQDELELPVRMGVHTGTPLRTEEGYVGPDVHRAARIAAAGHGRQVLVSATTAALVDAAVLSDLGDHRLKDLSAPERIFQLGDGEFPPLKTLHRTNLPIPATPFLGRDDELAEVRALLGRDDVRLLTLTGAGGSGKTRLALQAAAEVSDAYPDGVWWVPLAPLTDHGDVEPAAVRALGGGGTLPEIVDGRRLLLLLDNFEHVVEAAPDVGALLAECPHADVLVTSRERLRVQSEQIYPVPVLERAEARRLFVARARAARPDFEPDELLDDLCARLDDLPLALELAAARTSMLSTQQLLERLGDRLDLLRGGRDTETRQQTLRATIEWSYELLDPAERELLAALSVFRGGWTLDAAERVAGADIGLMESLLDKSLVRRWDSERLGMLETIREFAAERLEAGDASSARRRHADYFLALAEESGLCVEGLEAGKGEGGYHVVRPERDNIRAAIDFFVENAEFEPATRIAVSLEQYWATNSPTEGARILGELLERGDELPPELRVRAIRTRGGCIYIQGGFEEGRRFCDEALELYRELGETWGIGHMLLRRAVDESRLGQIEEAKASLAESLSLWTSPFNEAQVALELGTIAALEGRMEEALESTDRSARLAHGIDFVWWERNALLAGSEYALILGHAEGARERAMSSLRLAEWIGDRQGIVYSLAHLVWIAAEHGEAERAGRLWGAIETEALGGPIGQWEDERSDYEERISAVRGAEFDRAVEEGRRLSLADAVAYALASQT